MSGPSGFRNLTVRILAASAWIGACELCRNELLLGSAWRDHYADLGLEFPASMINNLTWGVWGVLFATLVALIGRRFNTWETFGLCWTAGFVLMWLVVGNLAVLPFSILPIAIPWSVLETFVTVKIVGAKP